MGPRKPGSSPFLCWFGIRDSWNGQLVMTPKMGLPDEDAVCNVHGHYHRHALVVKLNRPLVGDIPVNCTQKCRGFSSSLGEN